MTRLRLRRFDKAASFSGYGGSFGRCWTRTPIGSIWNRGRFSYCLKTARVYPFSGNGGSWRKADFKISWVASGFHKIQKMAIFHATLGGHLENPRGC
jgi:hypothetical protein